MQHKANKVYINLNIKNRFWFSKAMFRQNPLKTEMKYKGSDW
jgi:hypothetical protein